MVYALHYEGTGRNARLENDKMRLIAFQFCQMECIKKKRMFGASGRRTPKIYFMLVINF